jgi:hypothetical protein
VEPVTIAVDSYCHVTDNVQSVYELLLDLKYSPTSTKKLKKILDLSLLSINQKYCLMKMTAWETLLKLRQTPFL